MEQETPIQNPPITPTAETSTPSTSIRSTNRWLIPAILFVVGIALGAGGLLAYQKYFAVKPVTTVSPAPVVTPDPTANWKTYTNAKYGLKITYPASGIDASMNENVTCGQYIVEKSDSYIGNYIQFDGFFIIRVVAWSKTIDDYISSQDATGIYTQKPIYGSGADEALSLEGPAKDNGTWEGYPPLAYVNFIYKRGSNLFIIQGLQEPGQGCVPFTKSGSSFTISDWNIANSIKFAQ